LLVFYNELLENITYFKRDRKMTEQTVTIPRAEYERLLRLTTHNPINTAPNEQILVEFEYNEAFFWQECALSDKGEFEDHLGRVIDGHAQKWLPLPEVRQ
jgi:hypothetical protein